MKTLFYAAPLLLTLGLAACDSPQAQVLPDKPAQTQGQALEAPSQAQLQAAADKLQPLLAARHAEDLPARGDILKVEHGPQGLLWQARHGNPLLVRARALALLRHFPDKDSRELLLQTALSSGAPALLRSHAMMGLAGHSEGGDPEVAQALLQGAQDGERRVRLAARQTLEGSTSLRHLLEGLPKEEAAGLETQDLQDKLSPR